MRKEDSSKESRNDPKFRLLDMIMDFRNYSREYVVNNIPNIHRDIRIHFLDESYNLARNSVAAAHTTGNIRRKYITEMCVCISMLNVLIGEIKEVDTVPERRIEVMIGKLSTIKDCVYGWRSNEEAKR